MEMCPQRLNRLRKTLNEGHGFSRAVDVACEARLLAAEVALHEVVSSRRKHRKAVPQGLKTVCENPPIQKSPRRLSSVRHG